jgi:hypothetical protein
MPIRFRCEHCDQLMGIARRKAGTLVRCPNCQKEVHVPSDPAPPVPVAVAAPAPPAVAAPPAGVFDRDDFDVLLQGGAPAATESSRARAANGRGAPVASVGGTMGLDRWGPAHAPSASASGSYPPPPAGVVLSPLLATILTVAVILLLASAFGAGVLVGRAWG